MSGDSFLSSVTLASMTAVAAHGDGLPTHVSASLSWLHSFCPVPRPSLASSSCILSLPSFTSSAVCPGTRDLAGVPPEPTVSSALGLVMHSFLVILVFVVIALFFIVVKCFRFQRLSNTRAFSRSRQLFVALSCGWSVGWAHLPATPWSPMLASPSPRIHQVVTPFSSGAPPLAFQPGLHVLHLRGCWW